MAIDLKKYQIKEDDLFIVDTCILIDNFFPIPPSKVNERILSVKYEIKSIGRPKTDLKLMLGIMILQHLYNLSDPGMEDAIHDSFSFQSFLGLNPSTNSVPDETTILNFRHFLEEHKLQEKLFNEINAELIRQGYLLERASIVDATLIKAPSSTKNKTHSRDPEMSSTKKRK